MSQLPASPPPQYVDTGSSLPEVVVPGQHPYADAPQVINSGAHNAPELHYQNSGQYHQQLQQHHQQQYFDQSPEAVTYQGSDYKGAAAVAPYEVNGAGAAAAAATSAAPEPKPVPFWRRKRVLLIAAGVLVAIIVAAVVGGVVGSQKAKSGADSSSSAAGSNSSPATQTAQPPSSTTGTSSAASTATAAVMRPGSVASTSRGNAVFSQGIQVFWQDVTTSEISYSVYNNGADYGPLTKLELSRPPKGLTSLAATSWFVDNNATKDAIVQLYYLLETDSQGHVDVAMADLICTHNQTCTEQDTVILTTNVTIAEVDPFTDLAAVWRRDQSSFKYNNRVYFQAKGSGNIIELVGDSAETTGWGFKDLGVQAQNGSSLTAVFAPGYTMELYYFSPNGTLTEIVNTDHWADPVTIDVDPPRGAGGSGTLEACWEPSVNLFLLYYVDNKGNAMEYLRSGIGSDWSGGMSPSGQTIDQTIMCAAWDADLRLFYSQHGQMTRATRNKTAWKIDLLSDI